MFWHRFAYHVAGAGLGLIARRTSPDRHKSRTTLKNGRVINTKHFGTVGAQGPLKKQVEPSQPIIISVGQIAGTSKQDIEYQQPLNEAIDKATSHAADSTGFLHRRHPSVTETVRLYSNSPKSPQLSPPLSLYAPRQPSPVAVAKVASWPSTPAQASVESRQTSITAIKEKTHWLTKLVDFVKYPFQSRTAKEDAKETVEGATTAPARPEQAKSESIIVNRSDAIQIKKITEAEEAYGWFFDVPPNQDHLAGIDIADFDLLMAEEAASKKNIWQQYPPAPPDPIEDKIFRSLLGNKVIQPDSNCVGLAKKPIQFSLPADKHVPRRVKVQDTPDGEPPKVYFSELTKQLKAQKKLMGNKKARVKNLKAWAEEGSAAPENKKAEADEAPQELNMAEWAFPYLCARHEIASRTEDRSPEFVPTADGIRKAADAEREEDIAKRKAVDAQRAEAKSRRSAAGLWFEPYNNQEDFLEAREALFLQADERQLAKNQQLEELERQQQELWEQQELIRFQEQEKRDILRQQEARQQAILLEQVRQQYREYKKQQQASVQAPAGLKAPAGYKAPYAEDDVAEAVAEALHGTEEDVLTKVATEPATEPTKADFNGKSITRAVSPAPAPFQPWQTIIVDDNGKTHYYAPPQKQPLPVHPTEDNLKSNTGEGQVVDATMAPLRAPRAKQPEKNKYGAIGDGRPRKNKKPESDHHMVHLEAMATNMAKTLLGEDDDKKGNIAAAVGMEPKHVAVNRTVARDESVSSYVDDAKVVARRGAQKERLGRLGGSRVVGRRYV